MSYQLLLTTAGASKIATSANAGGAALHITDFAVGQGVDVDFSTRLDKQVLVAKRYQGTVESVAAVVGHPNQYEIVCVVPADVGGFTIREMGLIDSDGVLVWVGALPAVQKPDATSTAAVDYRLKAVVQIDNPAVSIVVDTNAITATQTWVNSTINKEFTDFQALFEAWKNSVNQDLETVKNRKIEPVSVGGLLITTNNYANSQAVHDGEGYGVWTRFAEGQALLGVGSHTDSSGLTKNFSMLQKIGTYQHTLTVDEMPSHEHSYGDIYYTNYGGTVTVPNGKGDGGSTDNDNAGNEISRQTQATGGNQPHNNIQPSIGVGIWLRLPDNYIAPTYDIYFTSDAQGSNRVTQIGEDSAIYLWIDVANAISPINVSKFTQQGAGEFISDSANLTYPATINNGKNLLIGIAPENYHVDMQTIIDWGFTLTDNMSDLKTDVHSALTINDIDIAVNVTGEFVIYTEQSNNEVVSVSIASNTLPVTPTIQNYVLGTYTPLDNSYTKHFVESFDISFSKKSSTKDSITLFQKLPDGTWEPINTKPPIYMSANWKSDGSGIGLINNNKTGGISYIKVVIG